MIVVIILRYIPLNFFHSLCFDLRRLLKLQLHPALRIQITPSPADKHNSTMADAEAQLQAPSELQTEGDVDMGADELDGAGEGGEGSVLPDIEPELPAMTTFLE